MRSYNDRLRLDTARMIRQYRRALRQVTSIIVYVSGRSNLDYAQERLATWRKFGKSLTK